MTTPPLLAPPEAQPDSRPSAQDDPPTGPPGTETLARPFRLGIVGLGAAVGLFARLSAANGFGDVDSRTMIVIATVTSALTGLGLLLMSAERDRFSAPLIWISGICALSWGTLHWISPPFADSVTVWSQPDQTWLALLGVGNGLLLAGLVALAFVRRGPTLSVAATLVAAVTALAADTIFLRDEWPAIISLGVAFALILLAWDRSPRRERTFTQPHDSPRVSRAALSFISVAFCGTAIQLWLSRTDIPRSIPAIALAVLLIGAAFASMIRVRREIERRETTLSEWTSWMREIRTNNFRAEMQNFDSTLVVEPMPEIGSDGEAPRALSFPNLTVSDEPDFAAIDAEIANIAASSSDLPRADAPPADADAFSFDARSGTKLPGADVTTETPHKPLLPTADVTTETPHEPLLSTADVVDATFASLTTPLSPPATGTRPERAGESDRSESANARRELPRIEAATGAAVRDAISPPIPPEPESEVPPPHPEPAKPTTGGAFSAILSAASEPEPTTEVGDLDAMAAWLTSPVAASRIKPLLVAVEAMSLDEYDSLPPEDAEIATIEIGRFLADTMPTADLISWIDGPYFIAAHASMPDSELAELHRAVLRKLRPTNGTLALLRPGSDATIQTVVTEAVNGILRARQLASPTS